MVAKRKKDKQPVQYDLFGNPIEEIRQAPKHEVVALQFEGENVRMTEIGGDPWWVATDVCRVLGYGRPRDALRNIKDKHKGAHIVRTPGGEQTYVVVSEAGLYELIMKSRRPEAVAFKDWVVEEVLPSIRKYGFYSLKPQPTRVDKIRKRLKCSEEVAHQRDKSIDANKALNSTIANAGGNRKAFRDIHNASYVGATGLTAAQLRELAGLPGYRSPQDAMGVGPLSQLTHAKWLASERIKAKAAKGITEDDYAVIEATTRHVVESDMRYLATLGHYVLAVVDDPRRGKVIDIVPLALPA